MLYDPTRHEPVQASAWDETRVRSVIREIVEDAESRFSPEHYWPVHPKDREGDDRAALTPLYFGAIGVIWALQYLRDLGAASLARPYGHYLMPLTVANKRWLGKDYEACRASFLMGDTPQLLMAYTQDIQNVALRTELEGLIANNLEHPSRELMWGAPGTMLAALFLHERTQDERWAHWFRLSARKLWSQLRWSEAHACQYWTQDLYGCESTYLDAVHGFVATAVPLIRGRQLLEEAEWSAWQQCIENTITRTATFAGEDMNWPVFVEYPPQQGPRFLLQFCHGAPGFVICLGDLPGEALDPLLLAAGETTWKAGPLIKGSNLCHGTGGNGYAFLKLYRRTGDMKWLERARAFAMHGIAQTEADLREFSQGRYSLWTGDVGFAIYLWDCLRGTAAFPTLDVF